jgi:hypothetical protein
MKQNERIQQLTGKIEELCKNHNVPFTESMLGIMPDENDENKEDDEEIIPKSKYGGYEEKYQKLNFKEKPTKRLKQLETLYQMNLIDKLLAYANKLKDVCNFVIQKLESELYCPLSLDKLRTPVILPSGHTIEKQFLLRLIDDEKPDPYDKTKAVKDIIVNRFAVNIQSTMKYIINKLKELESKHCYILPYFLIILSISSV